MFIHYSRFDPFSYTASARQAMGGKKTFGPSGVEEIDVGGQRADVRRPPRPFGGEIGAAGAAGYDLSASLPRHSHWAKAGPDKSYNQTTWQSYSAILGSSVMMG